MNASTDLLVPPPRKAIRSDEILALDGALRIHTGGSPESIARSLRYLGEVAEKNELRLGSPDATGSATGPTIRLERRTGEGFGEEGYRLEITAAGVEIAAAADRGLFRGVATLAQWIRQHHAVAAAAPVTLTGLLVEDAPAFANRGVMLDISRNRVPKTGTLLELVDRLAEWKINQLQLYTEHTFAYSRHPAVWRNASPMTAEEIRALDEYCAARCIELVPNQQSFGHMHRWLVHEPYRDLAECPDGIEHPFSGDKEPFSLCPTDPGSLELLAGLYDELLPNFSSRLLNVGLDETLDLGRGRSSTVCAERGRHRVYLEFMRQVHDLAAGHGRRIQFWADIALEHPELIESLPQDAIALAWGYEAGHPFAEQAASLAASGLEFYLCPGTSSWSSFAGRADNALRNLEEAAKAGRESGASGLLICDWGDHGHLQPLSASYLGLVAGASLAWNPDTGVHPSTPLWQQRLDMHAFEAPQSGLGRIAMALGNLYLATGTPSINGSPLFHLLINSGDPLDHQRYRGLSIRRLEVVLTAIGHAVADLQSVAAGSTAEIAVRELAWTARAVALGARIGIERFLADPAAPLDRLSRETRIELLGVVDALLEDLEPLWLERSRPGGLTESLRQFDELRTLLSA